MRRKKALEIVTILSGFATVITMFIALLQLIDKPLIISMPIVERSIYGDFLTVVKTINLSQAMWLVFPILMFFTVLVWYSRRR